MGDSENGNTSAQMQSSALNKVSNLECQNLYDYLKTRSSATLEKLYNHPTICLAVYRFVEGKQECQHIEVNFFYFLENCRN